MKGEPELTWKEEIKIEELSGCLLMGNKNVLKNSFEFLGDSERRNRLYSPAENHDFLDRKNTSAPTPISPLFFFFGFIFPRSAADKNQSEGRIILFFFFIILFWLLNPAKPREVGGRKILLRLLSQIG